MADGAGAGGGGRGRLGASGRALVARAKDVLVRVVGDRADVAAAEAAAQLAPGSAERMVLERASYELQREMHPDCRDGED